MARQTTFVQQYANKQESLPTASAYFSSCSAMPNNK